MSTNLTFQLGYIPQTVVIYGVGGTGSRIVPAVAQLMSTLPTLLNPALVLVDFDEVEAKNLARQNFAASDVGKNKALALAARYGKAYPQVKITPLQVAAGSQEYAEALEMYGLTTAISGPTLHILAVDSAAARRSILRHILVSSSVTSPAVIVDCGNEDIFGQVQVFTTSGLERSAAAALEFVYNWYQGVLGQEVVIPEIPMDVDHYLHLVDGESTRSCADLDQTLAINNLMAAQAIAIAQNLLMGKPMRYWRVSFDLFNGVSYDPICVREIIRRAAQLPEGGRLPTDVPEASWSNLLIYSTEAFSGLVDSLAVELEEDLLGGKVRYELSKSISESLNLPKFNPSLHFAGSYPNLFTEECIQLWNQGYVLPDFESRDAELYETAVRIFEELKNAA